MAQFHDPGLSLAVVDHFGIIWTKAHGVVEAGSDTPVTTKTLFQAGSISKPVAATGTYPDGKSVVGKWHVYPEMTAAGLWTTPTDLATFGIEIARSKLGNSNLVLSESMTRQMLTPQIENAGLGFFMAPDDANRFEHGGADEGFQAMFIMLGDEGQGAVVMANSDNGIKIANHLIESIAREYRWKSEHHKPSAGEFWISLRSEKERKPRYRNMWS
jgi:CubicO group peptidase (beta-lactamase class C family)